MNVWAGCVGVTLNSSEDSVPPSFGGGLLLFPRRQKATGGRGFPFFLPHPSERRLIGLSNARAFPKTLYQGLSLRCLRGFPSSQKCAFVQGWRSYNQRPRAGQVRRRAHSRRAPGKVPRPRGDGAG